MDKNTIKDAEASLEMVIVIWNNKFDMLLGLLKIKYRDAESRHLE